MDAHNSKAFDGFDLDEIQDLQEAEIEIRHPKTGAGLGAFFTLAGPEHPQRRSLSMKLVRQARAEAARAGAAATQAQRSGKPLPVTFRDPEEDFSESINLLASITLGWRGVIRGGEPLPYSQGAVLELYSDPRCQWLVRQLQAAMHAEDVFTKA